jgi:choline dehydrogenase-like flavoprotein
MLDNDEKTILVVGGGPVGMVSALELANFGFKVKLLTGESLKKKPKNKTLHGTTNTTSFERLFSSDPTLVDATLATYQEQNYLQYSRYLGNGGSSNTWIVRSNIEDHDRLRLVVPDERDFAARNELDIPGWPLEASDVLEKIDKALSYFGIVRSEKLPVKTSKKTVDLSSDAFKRHAFYFPLASAIFQDLCVQVREKNNIQVIDDLSFLKFKKSKDGMAVLATDNNGSIENIESDLTILAMGAIENVRHLLIAKKNGILKDNHNLVGAYYCDHPHIRMGYLECKYSLQSNDYSEFDFFEQNDDVYLTGYEVNTDYANIENVYRFSIDLIGRPKSIATKANCKLAKIKDLKNQKKYLSILRHAIGLMIEPFTTIRLIVSRYKSKEVHGTHLGGWSDPEKMLQKADLLAIDSMFEQRPSVSNRITLTKVKDEYGNELPNIDWRWSKKELKAFEKSVQILSEKIMDEDLSFTSVFELNSKTIPRATSGFHHIGGARMGENANTGVVDNTNRMFEANNVYIVGSAIFPNTLGFANPTLTAVADAIRVAEIIGRQN